MKVKDVAVINESASSKKNLPMEIFYLDTANLTEGYIGDIQRLNKKKDKIPSRAQRKVKDKTILYSTVRPRQHHYGILSNPPSNMIVSTGFATIDAKTEFVDPYYLYYQLTSQTNTEHLARIADTSVSLYPSITPEDIGNIDIKLPSISEQKRIAETIKVIDKKISLNHQINDNLEAMAKQLYDYWFVQFDFPNEEGRPYKSSGGEMVWNKKLKREIPKGWNETTLKSFIAENKGGDWGDDAPKDGTIRVGCVRGADIIKLNEVPTRYVSIRHSDRLLNDGDIVIEVSGGSPIQATGRVALITNEVIIRNGGALVCSNFCQSFSMKNRIFSEYFYYLWQSLYNNKNMFNYEGKTSGIKNFQTDIFLANHWYEAPEQLIERFHNIVSTYHLMIDKIIVENNNLTKQRDALLPLLMNGQVSINYHLSFY